VPASTILWLRSSQARPEGEILCLRQQLIVLRRSAPLRPRLKAIDRVIFVCLYRLFPSLTDASIVFQPETLLRWHRHGFRVFWRWKSWRRLRRPALPVDIQSLVRRISRENPLWGATRIHGELLKLGIEVAQSTVAKYMAKRRPGSGQTLRGVCGCPGDHACRVNRASTSYLGALRLGTMPHLLSFFQLPD